MRVVVDTNVAIVANGVNVHASYACQLRCIEFLQDVATRAVTHVIVLDHLGLILAEYRAHLKHRGQPGVGDFFYKFLHDNMYGEDCVKIAHITPSADETRTFEELPPNELDRSDRKFLAVAVVTRATVVNATDTDWHEHAQFLRQLGIRVRQLCPEHGCQ